MPVIFFHMGPAVVAKAAAPRYVSLRVFALTQTWSNWNPLLTAGTFNHMHYVCAGLGILGSVWWLGLARRHPREKSP